MTEIFPHTSLRPSPFYESTIAEGASVLHPYNKMLMPLSYGEPEAEYWRPGLVFGFDKCWRVGSKAKEEFFLDRARPC